MDASLDDIERAGSPRIREAIARVRAGNVHIAPGYDGRVRHDQDLCGQRTGKET